MVSLTMSYFHWKYNLHYIGIELNPEYCTLAEKRIGGEVP